MSWPPWLCRLVPYLGRGQAEEDLQDELRLHIELERERQRDTGMPEAAARRAARRTLGNATLIRERTRDVWGWRWLDDLVRDVRHAVRGLRRSPGFAATVVMVLALGIGANTAMFSIVHGLLIRPLPYPDSEAIVLVGQAIGGRSGPPTLSNPELRRLWAGARSFERLAASSRLAVLWNRPDGNLSGAAVTPSLFSVLRATPRLGRLFAPEDALAGAPRVVLLSHGVWTSRFGSDPDVVGASVEIEDEAHTVVGVLSEGFQQAYSSAQFWTPLVVAPYEPPPEGGPGFDGWMVGIGRLRSGVSPGQALTELQAILDRQREDEPWPLSPDGAPEARVVRLREWRGRPYRPALAMLGAATGLVLLLVCANVAGMLLARGIARQRELGIRGALGAGRGRVVRQLLTESVVLSVLGGAVGVAVATGIVRVAPALVPRSVPGLADVTLDGLVLAFAAGLSVAVGLLFGTAPAFAWSRVDLSRSFNGGSAFAGSFGRLRTNRGQAVPAVVQVALALVLLTGAGLLLRSFVAFVSLDRGFEVTGVVTADVRVDRPASVYGRGGRRIEPDAIDARNAELRQANEALLLQMERIENLPGVAAVALSSGRPLNSANSMRPVEVAGRPAPGDQREELWAGVRRVDPGYAEVMRLRLREGRFLADSDGPGRPRAAVVSESFARAAFGGAPPVGRHFRFAVDEQTWEVIGVVADVTPLYDMAFQPVAGDIYVSMLQPESNPYPLSSLPVVMVRTAGDSDAIIPLLREMIAHVHPEAQVYATTLETALSREAAQPRFYAVCAGIFALVALLLAAFGLYGVLSYDVSRRRREIGVRMALGARRRDVVKLVGRQAGIRIVTGVGLGLLAAGLATRVVESILFGVTPTDAVTLTGATAVVLGAGFLACWLPTRRATRVDPIDVLRFE